MATINPVTPANPIYNTLQVLGSNKALAWLDQIMAAQTGTASGEDALAVLNRKMEATGILASGTSLPIHGTNSPLFFYKIDDDTLHIKGATSYSSLADDTGFADNVIIGVGTTTPAWNAAHSAAVPLIFYNTTTAELWLKATGRYVQVTSTAGDVGYNPPSGSNILRSSVDTVEDALNDLEQYLRNNPPGSGGGGMGTDDQTASEVNTNTSQFNNNLSSSDTTVQAALDTIDNLNIGSGGGTDDQTASEVNTNTANFNNNLSSADTTVQAALDTLDNLSVGAGGGTDDQTATEVPTSTANFNQNLSTTDTNVQRALDTIDNLDIPPYYDETFSHTSNLLNTVGSHYTQSFTIPQKLRDFRDRFAQDLYLIADSHIEISPTVGNPQTVTYVFEILDSTGNALADPITSGSVDITNSGQRSNVRRDIRLNAVLPRDFNGGRLNTRVTNVVGNTAAISGVDFQRIQVYVDPSAIDPSDFDGNLSQTDNTTQKVAQKFDDFTGANLSITSSGFNGNLATTDDTAQKVAQALDDLVLPSVPAPQNAAGVPISSTPRNAFSDPNNFPGGIRGVTLTDTEPYELNPNDVRAALRSTDARLQDLYNPFEKNQVLDHGVGASSDFVINSATEVISNPITIPQELRDLSTDVDIRLRMRISAIGTGWVGDLQLVHKDYDHLTTPITTTYGDPESVTRSTKSAGDYVTFERTIQASMVPDQFKVKFRRTGGTTSATFHRGVTWVFDSLGGSAGGAGGQASGYRTTIIWLAGASIYDRLTTASETTNHTLMAGHNFSDYDELVFVYDGGAGSTQPLMQVRSDTNLFQAFGAAGFLDIKGNWWLMVSRQDDRTFRFRWRAPSNGLRRIIGINTS